VETLAQAEQSLRQQNLDMIICTIVFNESKMFDLLRLAKSKPESQRIPFVGARVRLNLLLSPDSLRAAAVTCAAMGAEAFLNITDFQTNPEQEMREAIERFLNKASTSDAD
jgi:hypothetical protein